MPTGPKLQSTDGPTINALVQQIRNISKEVDGATERDITQAAFHLALKAERGGTPYTLDAVEHMSDNEKITLSEALGMRIKTHTESNQIHITDSSGVVGSADSMKGVMDITEGERAA